MLTRLRHTYGFGVHSPSAYALVKEVLTLPREYAYYGYWDIEAAEGTPKETRQAKLLLRLITHLGIRNIISPSAIPPSYKAALQCFEVTNVSMEVTLPSVTNTMEVTLPSVTNTSLLFLPHGISDKNLLKHWLESGSGALLIFGLKKGEAEGIADWVMENMKSGIVLDGRTRLIALHRPDTIPVRYKIL